MTSADVMEFSGFGLGMARQSYMTQESTLELIQQALAERNLKSRAISTPTRKLAPAAEAALAGTLTLTIEETAEELRCHANTVRRLIKSGALKVIYPTADPRVLRSELVKYLDRMAQ